MSSLAIKHAVIIAGSNAALAQAIDVHESAISLWKTGRRAVPAHYCLKVEEATAGEVTRYDLRPDVFGQKPNNKNH
jgi:DNA-binding transcriptional regulator YdaS (Cro superfamily)